MQPGPGAPLFSRVLAPCGRLLSSHRILLCHVFPFRVKLSSFGFVSSHEITLGLDGGTNCKIVFFFFFFLAFNE